MVIRSPAITLSNWLGPIFWVVLLSRVTFSERLDAQADTVGNLDILLKPNSAPNRLASVALRPFAVSILAVV